MNVTRWSFVVVMVIASHVSCSPPSTENQDKPRMNDPDVPDRTAATDDADAIPVCTTLACLVEHEGTIVQIVGTYQYPKQKAFAVNRLALDDKTPVIVGGPREDPFVEANDGVLMAITGRIFTKDIPEKYRIIGRTPEPHLLDVSHVQKKTLKPPQKQNPHPPNPDRLNPDPG
jgi:hypothetical protein